MDHTASAIGINTKINAKISVIKVLIVTVASNIICRNADMSVINALNVVTVTCILLFWDYVPPAFYHAMLV